MNSIPNDAINVIFEFLPIQFVWTFCSVLSKKHYAHSRLFVKDKKPNYANLFACSLIHSMIHIPIKKHFSYTILQLGLPIKCYNRGGIIDNKLLEISQEKSISVENFVYTEFYPWKPNTNTAQSPSTRELKKIYFSNYSNELSVMILNSTKILTDANIISDANFMYEDNSQQSCYKAYQSQDQRHERRPPTAVYFSKTKYSKTHAPSLYTKSFIVSSLMDKLDELKFPIIMNELDSFWAMEPTAAKRTDKSFLIPTNNKIFDYEIGLVSSSSSIHISNIVAQGDLGYQLDLVKMYHHLSIVNGIVQIKRGLEIKRNTIHGEILIILYKNGHYIIHQVKNPAILYEIEESVKALSLDFILES